MQAETESARARRLVVAAARRAGIDAGEMRLIRAASATLIDLPRAGVVARVERAVNEHFAQHQVSCALHFERSQAPVVRLVHPELQPLHVDDGVVTLWMKLEQQPTPLTYAGLGSLARQLHACVQDPPADLPRLTPHEHLSPRLNTPVRVPTADVAALRDRIARCLSPEEFAALDDPLGTVLLHGDVHLDNIIVTAEGPRFVDIELSGVGPASWDLVPAWLHVRRYGLPEDRFDALIRGYGADPRSWPSFHRIVDLYELQAVTWSIMNSTISDEMAAEAQRRIDSYLGRADHRWTLL